MSFLSRASRVSSLRAACSHSARSLSSAVVVRGTFEPDYLDSSGPVIPTYPPLNIQIKGKQNKFKCCI